MSDLAEIDRLSGEGRHRAIIVQVSSANWQVFVELNFFWLLLLQVIALASQAQRI